MAETFSNLTLDAIKLYAEFEAKAWQKVKDTYIIQAPNTINAVAMHYAYDVACDKQKFLILFMVNGKQYQLEPTFDPTGLGYIESSRVILAEVHKLIAGLLTEEFAEMLPKDLR